MNEKIEPTQNIKNKKIKKVKFNIFEAKIILFKEIIIKTVLSIQRYKLLDIYGPNDLNTCLNNLNELSDKLNNYKYYTKNSSNNEELIVTKLQEINNDLSILFRSYGTHYLEDLLIICFGIDYTNNYVLNGNIKYELLKKYVHPISYKVMNWTKNNKNNKNIKTLKKNRIVEDFMIMETAENLDCFDLMRTSKNFNSRVYGIKIIIQNLEQNKLLICSAIVDDVMINSLDSEYITNKLMDINKNKPTDPDFNTNTFTQFIESLTLKELLIYSNSDLYEKFAGYLSQIQIIKQKTIDQIVKEFISSDIFNQRKTLILLLLKSDDTENQYLSYLLYDLLSNDINNSIDTREQTLILDSLPWNIKKYFKNAMKQTIEYSQSLNNYDQMRAPLEQQICLLKVPDIVKEKAMTKLKEIKAKSEDTGSKARQYLEGLLKIPFNIYKNEPIFNVTHNIQYAFSCLVNTFDGSLPKINIPIKPKYGIVDIQNHLFFIQNEYLSSVHNYMVDNIKTTILKYKRSELIGLISVINKSIKVNKIDHPKLLHSGKKSNFMKKNITEFIDTFKEMAPLIQKISIHTENKPLFEKYSHISSEINRIEEKKKSIQHYISNMENIMDKSIYGHKSAKNQIKRIIGQWINGKPTGYCLGFEGPPGVGKTTLAKMGIRNCLLDDNNNPRPFGFIAAGGSSNSSTFDGHNYTYVGSTWGRIVDILIESKCMNPIIFIDELDKISKTEHGKEIIGILTHLTDSTQNDAFHDKYFSGIDLDLSKALIIFSYNDPGEIDRILLDRIHRIKFGHLTLADKVIICNEYMLPQLYDKMGLNDIFEIDDEILEFIIEEYTLESGVRKLKEILNEIVGEINLNILHTNTTIETPIKLTKDDIQFIYLKEKQKRIKKSIHKKNTVSLITGLWANQMGMGGILPIEAKYYPTKTFLELKLTGMQGDVMKESMSVGKTLAWSKITDDRSGYLAKHLSETQNQGIHIHVPEGATPKDGPSAGTAITVTLYSLFTGRKIKHNIAITGEICLNGNVTAIGGLDLKILGGTLAGVTEFLFPKENEDDFKKLMEKKENQEKLNGIKFHMIETIDEALDLALE
jgi:ATP-dependent Lon protease